MPITYYVALPFSRDDNGEAQDRQSAHAAIARQLIAGASLRADALPLDVVATDQIGS